MNAAGRLSLYGAGVVVAFGGAFGIAAAVVPDSAVANWTAAADDSSMADHAGMTGEDTAETATIPGVSLSGYGYELSPIAAPSRASDESGPIWWWQAARSWRQSLTCGPRPALAWPIAASARVSCAA